MNTERKQHPLLIGLFVAVVHFGFRKLGFLLAIGGGVTPLSPSVGVAWALLLVLGVGYWPAIFLAGFLASLTFGVPWPVAVCLAAATVIKVIAGVRLFSWFGRFRSDLGYLETLAAGLSTALVTPLLGVTLTLTIQRLFRSTPLGRNLLTWNTMWLEDMLAILIAAAVVIPLLEPIRSGWRDWNLKRLAGVATITTVVAGVSWLVIVKTPSYPAFFLLPPMLLLSVWIEETTSGLAATAIAAIAIWAVETGHGPLAGGTAPENANNVTFFVVSVMVTALAIWCFSRAKTLPLAGSVVVGGCFVAGLLFLSFDGNRIDADRHHLEGVVDSARGEIKQQLDEYESVLRGASQYLSGTPRINRAMWQVYVENLHLLDRYPGASAMSVVLAVDSNHLGDFAAGQRALNHAGFEIHTATGGTNEPITEHFIVAGIEPTAIGPVALGADQATDPLRKQAIDVARDSGNPTLSRPIRVFRNGQFRTAFALYVPVYGAGALLDTEAERRAAFIAVTNSVVGTKEFFDQIFLSQPGQLEMSVFDGKAEEANLMYRSAGQSSSPFFERTDQMTIGGTTWTIGWNRGPDFGPVSRAPGAWAVGGVQLASLLLAGLVMILQSNGRRTEAIVQKRTAELGLALDAAGAANQAKAQFLANMSHEIRTPMNGVIAMTEVVLEMELNSDARGCIETIQESGQALMTVVNDILDFSKIEAGKLDFETLDLEVSVVVDGSVRLLAGTARKKGLEITSLVHPDVSKNLRGDPGRLRQVLVNLIGNAVKFSDAGKITVEVLKEFEDACQVLLRFSVKDQGIGIPTAIQAKLFSPFTQADGSTTRKYGGTGLGLALSKLLVERMGGEIGVESSAGNGSTFWFTTRLQKQGAAGVESPPAEQTQVTFKTALQ